MLDFCARGADGVTVRRVTLFVVVFKMAGGLPSLALVATGEELRNVFMVAVVNGGAPAELPSARVPPGVARSEMRAPAGLPSGRVPPILALAEAGFLGFREAPRARAGLLGAS